MVLAREVLAGGCLFPGIDDMKTHFALTALSFALSTLVASAAVAQDPSPKQKPAAESPRRAPAAKPRPADEPAAKKAAEEAEQAVPEEAAAPDEEAASEQASEEQAAPAEGVEEQGAAEEEAAEEVATEPEEEPAQRTRASKREPAAAPSAEHAARRPAAVPPAYYGPAALEYGEGGTVPPGYIKDTRVRRGMVIGGAVTWGVGWLLAATAATAIVQEDKQHGGCAYDDYGNSFCNDNDDLHPAAALYVPLIGPFITMAAWNDELDGGGSALLFLNGMVQVTGFSLLVAGVAAKKTVLVRDPGVTISLAPGPGGATLHGTF
jgi:flagellar motor protein MotB